MSYLFAIRRQNKIELQLRLTYFHFIGKSNFYLALTKFYILAGYQIGYFEIWGLSTITIFEHICRCSDATIICEHHYNLYLPRFLLVVALMLLHKQILNKYPMKTQFSYRQHSVL